MDIHITDPSTTEPRTDAAASVGMILLGIAVIGTLLWALLTSL